MSAAKAKPKRWAIVPPSSSASDAASRRLGSEVESASPATLRSRPGIDLGPHSGARGVESVPEVGDAVGPQLSRRQRRRSQRPDGAADSDAPRVMTENESLESLRARETLGHESLAVEARGPDGVPPAAATWMSPGMSAVPADETEGKYTTESAARESRPRTARRRVECPTTLTSLPDGARGALAPRGTPEGREPAADLLGYGPEGRRTLRSPAERVGGQTASGTAAAAARGGALGEPAPETLDAGATSAPALPGSQEARDTIPAPPWLGEDD